MATLTDTSEQPVRITKLMDDGYAWGADTRDGSAVMVSEHLVNTFSMKAGDEYIMRTRDDLDHTHPYAFAIKAPGLSSNIETPDFQGPDTDDELVSRPDTVDAALAHAIDRVVKAQARADRASRYLDEALDALKALRKDIT